MPEGFKRPGQGSRVGKAPPFSLGGDAQKGGIRSQGSRKSDTITIPSAFVSSGKGIKRACENAEDQTRDTKKAREETYTSPMDLFAFRAPVEQAVAISKDRELADFFGGTDQDEAMEFEDMEIEPVDNSPDVDPLFPGLCSTKLADENQARHKKQEGRKREARVKELESIAKVAATIPDLSFTASYNTYENCPFKTTLVAGNLRASRGEDRFEDGTLSLKGDKQYIQWTRLGSEYAVVTLKVTELNRITWNSDSDFATLALSKDFPADFDEPAKTKPFVFHLHCEDAVNVAKFLGSALKRLRKAIKPDPIMVPKATTAQNPTPTPADSGYSGSPPPTALHSISAVVRSSTGHTPSEIAANNAETLKFREALKNYGASGSWGSTTFSKANMRAFLEAKDKFHNIVDSTAWARGLGSKCKLVAQARIVAYLDRYPNEGVAVPIANVMTAGRKGKKNQDQTAGTGSSFEASWNGIHLGWYKTNDERMEVMQTAMLAESQEAHEGGKDRRFDDGTRMSLQG